MVDKVDKQMAEMNMNGAPTTVKELDDHYRKQISVLEARGLFLVKVVESGYGCLAGWDWGLFAGRVET